MKHRIKRSYPQENINIADNEQGMTLLEVLVALVILSLVLVTMLTRFAQAGRQSAEDYHYNEAISLAQSKIEEIKKKNFDSVDNVAATDFSIESDYTQFQGLRYSVTVTPHNITVNGIPRLYTKTVTVTVYYNDQGIAKQLDLTAEVARR